MRKTVVILALTLVSAVFAAEADALSDGVDRNDPNFVKASLLVMSPGEELFSCAGHACLRLECPEFKLDNCFTYESEGVRDKVLTFFAGKLKMGMFRLPMAEFMKMNADDDVRSLRQYRLNLPADVKRRLWKVMDDMVEEGANLPYDYVHRGCAWSVLSCLREAAKPYEIVPGAWPEKFSLSRREILASAVADCPWFRFAHQAIIGADVDFGEKPADKVILPADLVAFLQGARLAGQPMLSQEYEELKPQTAPISPASWFTPIVAATLLLGLAVGNVFVKMPCFDWTLLLLQSLAGAFFTYLVVFSDLPATTWNWHLVPFNLLPLIFWKWRKKWALAFAAALLAWVAGMLLSPHRLTDSAYLVIVLGYVVFYAKVWRSAWSADPAGNAQAV